MDAFPEDSICQALAFIEALDALEAVVGSNPSSRSATAIPGSSTEVLSSYVENKMRTVNEAMLWAYWQSCLLIAVRIGEDRPRTREVGRERSGVGMWPTAVRALGGRNLKVDVNGGGTGRQEVGDGRCRSPRYITAGQYADYKQYSCKTYETCRGVNDSPLFPFRFFFGRELGPATGAAAVRELGPATGTVAIRVVQSGPL
ncbi:hypothetical protein DFH09DRAFT_1111789 [Mycena vulgaris]|nr:hypothetical protein DFH09DRAFT_1111789 [Mycena vulgaris]